MTTALASIQGDVEPTTSTTLSILPELPALPEAHHAFKALEPVKRIQLLEAILAHYESGASIYALAEQLGVNNASIYRALKKYKVDDWKEVASARYEAEIEDAEKELKTAPDAIAVTRARERIASARWKLERLDRKNYGQDAVPTTGQAININIGIRRGPLDVVGDANAGLVIDQKP